ncbi:MAG: Alkaline phosphatase [Mycobacterium sp.]|nr:Alkaline phosphatase [Mycobacterium sp.]
MSHRPTRRALLKGAVVLVALPVAGFTGRRRGPVLADPFTLGVASGEPAPDGAVIWTRLAPDPLADDDHGGMPARPVDVDWEIAADEAFTRIEQRGTTTAVPQSAHSVHVELTGLRPGADHFYRFRAAGHHSQSGRSRTAPGVDGRADDVLRVVLALRAGLVHRVSPARRGAAGSRCAPW